MSTESGEFSFNAGDRVYGFEPFGWQGDFVMSTADEVLGSGAFGSGKTRAGCEKAALQAALYPGNHVLVARRTHSSLTDTTLRTLTDEVLPDSWIQNHNKGQHRLEIRSPLYPAAYCRECGWETYDEVEPEKQACPKCDRYALESVPLSEISYKGLNTAAPGRDLPSNILSMNLGAVYVDEMVEIEEKHYLLLAGRLRLRRLDNPYVPELPVRQIFGTTNPGSEQHWIYKRFYPPEPGKREVYESATEDNPHNPDDYVTRLQGQYSGVMADRYIGGEWVGFEGRVYDEFDETTHVISPLELTDLLGDGWTVHNIDALRANRESNSDPVGAPDSDQYTPARISPPEDARLLLSIDWGYRPDPTVVQWWAETPEYGYVMYREFFKTRTLPGQVAKYAMEYMDPQEVSQISRVFSDHDSGNRENWMAGLREWVDEKRSKGEDVTDWDTARLRTTAAHKSWETGFNEMKRLMRVDDNGRSEMYFVKGARAHEADRHLQSAESPTTTRTELRSYRWKDEESDEPIDEHDHGCDSARYLAASDRKMRRGDSEWDTRVHKS